MRGIIERRREARSYRTSHKSVNKLRADLSTFYLKVRYVNKNRYKLNRSKKEEKRKVKSKLVCGKAIASYHGPVTDTVVPWKRLANA